MKHGPGVDRAAKWRPQHPRRPPGRSLRATLAALLALTTLATTSCRGPIRNPLSREKVVLEEKRTLADGESMFFTLDGGRYRAEVTARGDRVTVEWRGADCPRSDPTASYVGTCEFAAQGQLLVQNPRDAVPGAPSEVAITVTKLAL